MQREENFLKELMSLFTIESAYIYELYKLIYSVCGEISLTNSREFREFIEHYHLFARFQAASEATLLAIDSLQRVYRCTLLQPLLDSQVMAAAEQLESAIEHLELATRDRAARTNSQFILLNQSLCTLEENHLKILELLEEYMEKCCSDTQLQN